MDIQQIICPQLLWQASKGNNSDSYNNYNDNVGTPFLLNCLHKVAP